METLFNKKRKLIMNIEIKKEVDAVNKVLNNLKKLILIRLTLCQKVFDELL